ncbi:hypothetical protein PISL3812_05488 [Talaromyces islandicus]|uniref:Uncharacterized protein n=1 Tax=Talaromyces islandicus TaxID=28573 RepID=A0A0U1LYN7_TALIS|nr:hypothetical protein PISL3812_05488 [Talaromyces islandicus]
MASYVITGSSRGIGLGLVSLLASLPASQVGKVFATSRQDNSPKLTELIKQHPDRVQFVQLDVTDRESVKRAAAEVERVLDGKPLDVLINNAGFMPWTSGGVVDADDLAETFNMNVVSVHNVTRAFLPMLVKGETKKVFNISTSVGSIAQANRYMHLLVPSYKITKAALNMLTKQYALEFADAGFTFVALSPGWLQTDMGGEGADLPVDIGVRATLHIVHSKTKKDNGRFFNIKVAGWENKQGPNQYNGAELPW